MASGWGRMAVKCSGPARLVTLQTTRCMESSGVIHGPPLPHQPASLFMLISRPRRWASRAGVLDEVAPQRAGETGRPRRGALIGFHVEHAADADPLHGLQVGGDAVAGEVAVERKPINPGPGRGGRLEEVRGPVVAGGRRGGSGPERAQEEEEREFTHIIFVDVGLF